MPQKPRKIFRFISLILCFLLIFEQSGFAQVAAQINLSGHLAALKSSVFPDKFRPLHLRYLSYSPDSNDFHLLLDKGDSKDLKPCFVEESSKTLLKYFVIGVSLPNSSFWVNLRPDSPKDIIEDLLAQTEVGKILLESDFISQKGTLNNAPFQFFNLDNREDRW